MLQDRRPAFLGGEFLPARKNFLFCECMNKRLDKYEFASRLKSSQIAVLLFAALVFGGTASAPLFWGNGYASAQLLGFGDYLSPFNSRDVLHSLLYSYDPNINGGLSQSFNQTYLFYYAAHYLIEVVVGTSAIATTIILSILLFISQAGFYIYLREKLNASLTFDGSIILTAGSVIYGFSPYFITNTYPGHISALILFAFAPYLFLLFDRNLESNNYSISKRDASVLILVLLAAAPAFANIGNFIALVIALAIYAMGHMATQSFNPMRVLTKYVIFVVLMVLLSSWWMLPFAAGLKESIQLSAGANQIAQSVSYATQHSTVKNIYSGLPESLFHEPGLLKHQLYSHWYIWGALLLVAMTALAGVLIKMSNDARRWLMALMILLVFSAFITKGPNPPFGNLFQYLLDNVTVFNIFRRPGSKIYWAYWFSLVSVSTYMAVLVARSAAYRWRLPVNPVSLVFVLIAVAATVLFVRTPLLKSVTPSDGYYQAATYLNAQPSARILAFPSTDGQPHTMGMQNDGYYGVDVFRAMLQHPVLIPDLHAAAGGAKTSIVSQVNHLANNVASAVDSCEAYKQIGITHVVFRADAILNSDQKDQYQKALIASSTSRELQFVDQYGPVTIFKVDPKCVGKSIEQLNSEGSQNSVLTERTSPTTIHLNHIDNLVELNIVQRENYSRAWVVSVNGTSVTGMIKEWLQRIMNYAFPPARSELASGSSTYWEHDICNGWANCWRIRFGRGDERLGYTIRYVIQDFLYLGILVTLMTSIVLVTVGYGRNNTAKVSGSASCHT